MVRLIKQYLKDKKFKKFIKNNKELISKLAEKGWKKRAYTALLLKKNNNFVN